MSIWGEIGLVVRFWTVIAIPSACFLGFLFCRLDRNPKDGPRCRACGFDLRASRGDQCPECGASLKPRGIWPPGKPSRFKLAIALSAWTWAAVCFGIGLQIFYNDYEEFLIQEWEISTNYATIYGPNSRAFENCTIIDNGRGSALLPDEYDYTWVDTDQVILWLETNTFETIACAFDLNTGLTVEPRGPFIDELLQYAKVHSTNSEQIDAVSFLLQALELESESPNNRDTVHSELYFIVEHSKKLVENKHSSSNWEDSDDWIFSTYKESDYDDYFYGHYWIINGTEYYSYPLLYDWPQAMYIPPSVVFALWVAGIFALRKAIYRAQAIDEIPTTPLSFP